MIDPTLPYENLDALIIAANAKARIAATAIRQDVLHHLKPLERTGAKRLLKAIERRMIFEKETLIELDVLNEKLEGIILAGTTEMERWDASEENVSAPAVWIERHRTQQAEDVARAFIVLHDFHETLQAVHDLVQAEVAINKLRQAS